ncbi:methyl-accepting chemotaxis protein, partial [Campylobacter sp. 2018MI10]|uniref:cache domain-containing protein n=1 Tax=Campylobacter sp. 2018MI10 TaxID=2836736 RepID=UPI001BD99837
MLKTIKAKLGFVIILGLFVLFLMLYLFYNNNQKTIQANSNEVARIMQVDIEEKLKISTDAMINALSIHLKDLQSEKEKIDYIAQAIENFRFDNGNGYFFVYKDTTAVAHPVSKKLIGQDLKGMQASDGTFFIQELSKKANSGGGFVTFPFPKPGTDITAPKLSYIALIPNTNSLWIGTGVYLDEIDKNTHELENLINSSFVTTSIIALFVFIVVFIPYIVYVMMLIVKSLSKLNNGINEFFSFLNHEKEDAHEIILHSKDEFGSMAKAINDNIEKTKLSLLKDEEAVEQSVQTAAAIESGDLKARITLNPANPQLIELKNVLNKMLDTLEEKVGANTNSIEKIFDEYSQNDFRNEIKNAKGRVELATNMLGKQIRDMLKTNLETARNLQDKSKILKTSVKDINEGARKQASSLQESAAAVEEMSASMHAVNQKSNEVIKNGE